MDVEYDGDDDDDDDDDDDYAANDDDQMVTLEVAGLAAEAAAPKAAPQA